MRPYNTVIKRQVPLNNLSNNLTQHRPTFYTFFLFMHVSAVHSHMYMRFIITWNELNITPVVLNLATI